MRIIYCDYPESWQSGFQDIASPTMYGIVELHDHIIFYLIIVSTVVTWFLIRGIMMKNQIIYSRHYHGHLIEFLWTLTPAFILGAIALPSFRLLYLADEIIEPQITVKAIGNQWYWSALSNISKGRNLILILVIMECKATSLPDLSDLPDLPDLSDLKIPKGKALKEADTKGDPKGDPKGDKLKPLSIWLSGLINLAPSKVLNLTGLALKGLGPSNFLILAYRLKSKGTSNVERLMGPKHARKELMSISHKCEKSTRAKNVMVTNLSISEVSTPHRVCDNKLVPNFYCIKSNFANKMTNWGLLPQVGQIDLPKTFNTFTKWNSGLPKAKNSQGNGGLIVISKFYKIYQFYQIDQNDQNNQNNQNNILNAFPKGKHNTLKFSLKFFKESTFEGGQSSSSVKYQTDQESASLQYLKLSAKPVRFSTKGPRPFLFSYFSFSPPKGGIGDIGYKGYKLKPLGVWPFSAKWPLLTKALGFSTNAFSTKAKALSKTSDSYDSSGLTGLTTITELKPSQLGIGL
jgi:hypothetical protein